jgi:hypothetical protein
MKPRQGSRIGQIFADGRRIDEALRLAALDAIRKHELHNAPVVIWRNGRTAWVSAQELSTGVPPKTARRRKPVSKRGR